MKCRAKARHGFCLFYSQLTCCSRHCVGTDWMFTADGPWPSPTFIWTPSVSKKRFVPPYLVSSIDWFSHSLHTRHTLDIVCAGTTSTNSSARLDNLQPLFSIWKSQHRNKFLIRKCEARKCREFLAKPPPFKARSGVSLAFRGDMLMANDIGQRMSICKSACQ